MGRHRVAAELLLAVKHDAPDAHLAALVDEAVAGVASADVPVALPAPASAPVPVFVSASAPAGEAISARWRRGSPSSCSRRPRRLRRS